MSVLLNGVPTDKESAVLKALSRKNMSVDQFVGNSKYVNSWAPAFTYLKQAGMIIESGKRVVTRHGGSANVFALTTNGRKLARRCAA